MEQAAILIPNKQPVSGCDVRGHTGIFNPTYKTLDFHFLSCCQEFSNTEADAE